jgi:succinate dehydrogenase / fumarate reductase membrane anchor subunit
MNNNYRSTLYTAKNLGSAGYGAKHWWYQRFTALLLALITMWLFYFSWKIANSELSETIEVIKKPANLAMLLIFVITGIYHGVLGIQVIIEDYVHYRMLRLFFLLFVQIFSIFTAVSFIVTILYIVNL